MKASIEAICSLLRIHDTQPDGSGFEPTWNGFLSEASVKIDRINGIKWDIEGADS